MRRQSLTRFGMAITRFGMAIDGGPLQGRVADAETSTEMTFPRFVASGLRLLKTNNLFGRLPFLRERQGRWCVAALLVFAVVAVGFWLAGSTLARGDADKSRRNFRASSAASLSRQLRSGGPLGAPASPSFVGRTVELTRVNLRKVRTGAADLRGR